MLAKLRCGQFYYTADNLGAHIPDWDSHAGRTVPRPGQIFAYFFDMSSCARKSGLSVMQSLLHRILSTEQGLFELIYSKPIFSRPQQDDFGQFVEILNAILHDPSPQDAIVVLDALDDHEEEIRQSVCKDDVNLSGIVQHSISSHIETDMSHRADSHARFGLFARTRLF